MSVYILSISMTLSKLTAYCQQYIANNTIIIETPFQDIQHAYSQLIDCITDHNHLYYIDSEPLITDKEYDDLFSYLKKIEKSYPQLINENSPTQQLIWQISEWFVKAEHTLPLLSLENSYNASDLIEFDEFNAKRIWDYHYFVQPKFDGISVEIIYKNWILHQAITRWDWKIGEDITTNVKQIKNLPKKLVRTHQGVSTLSVRWEIMMPKSVRSQINQQRDEDWLSRFANTRNAAWWTIKLLDSGEVSKRGLVVYIYDLLSTNNQLQFETAQQELEYMKEIWLPVFERNKEKMKIAQVIEICENSQTKDFFEKQDIDFDGIVIKINELSLREELGMTEHHPRRAIAYKFPAQQVATQILSVDFQVWRTGILTPVGNLEPVQLSGVIISRVSLHNMDFITNKDLHIGDWVWIQRSWEVIPYVVWVINDRRDNDTIKPIIVPTNCPNCKQEITEIDWHNYCTNTQCPAILLWKLEYFVSKQCMNIDGIWISILQILIEQWIVSSISDLYKLADNEIQQQLKRIPWFGDKKINHMVAELEKSKSAPLRRIINALWFNGVGKKTAQEIANHIHILLHNEWILALRYDKLQAILTDQEFMSQIEWIGEIIKQSFVHYFNSPENLKIYQELQLQGVLLNLSEQKTSHWPLSWQQFSLTWTFPISRDELISLFESQWATFQSSPNKKSDFMLTGDKPGSKKEKAEKLQIKIYDNRDSIKKDFSFLQSIKINEPVQQGLFG